MAVEGGLRFVGDTFDLPSFVVLVDPGLTPVLSEHKLENLAGINFSEFGKALRTVEHSVFKWHY
ncbi:hypothetical protein D3C76_1492170 [compost metagenome]